MKTSRLARGALAIAKRILLILYLIVPLSILLFAREPEITSTIGENTILVMLNVLIMVPAGWKWGYRGVIPCLAVGLSALVYAMDARLWHPPPDFNLRETISVVTGANSGLGKATALSLARLGSHVILTCRSLDKCQQTVQDVNAAGAASGGHATAAVLNLTSLESVNKLVTELSTTYPKIHYLFNNAGSTPIFNLTEQGLEDGFGGMHLAHMALTLGLLPSLRAAGTRENPSRIIMTSSEASITVALGFLGDDAFPPSFLEGNGEGDLRGEVTRGDGNGMSSHAAYGRAKLCNNLFAFELNRRLRRLDWPVVINTLHTGSVATKTAAAALGDLFRGIPGLPFLVTNVYVPLLWRIPQAGSSTLLYTALSNDASLLKGGQYVDALCRPLLDEEHPINSKIVQEKVKALRRADEQWALRLWDISLRLLSESPANRVVANAP
jgi:NAD(P)-dependent dehydrogenase (short-subunit alcohol dehydrogenase family)